jgi:apyrase
MLQSGFYVVAKFLQLPDGAPLDQVLAAGEQLCRRPWSWVQQHLDGHVNVEKYCTWAPYTVKLLREGLRLRDEQIHTGTAARSGCC